MPAPERRRYAVPTCKPRLRGLKSATDAAQFDAKSLSHKCAPHDDGRGEVNEGEVVLRLLLPPDEQLATAVEPRGRSFDDPPAGACPVPAGRAPPPPPPRMPGAAAAP